VLTIILKLSILIILSNADNVISILQNIIYSLMSIKNLSVSHPLGLLLSLAYLILKAMQSLC